MRTLTTAPSALLDPATGAARFGSYEGSISGVDLAPLASGRLQRIAREKRWIYASLATDEVFAAAAVVRLGYSATAFSYVYDAKAGRIAAHESALGIPAVCDVSDDRQRGVRGAFSLGRTRYRVEKDPSGDVLVEVRAGAISIDAQMRAERAPPSITAVAKIPEGIIDVTEKRTLLAAKGSIVVGDRRWSLDGGHGGFDLTQGLLARRTRWRWAFAMGRTDAGVRFGMNLVQGFVGEPECALWIGDELMGVGEGRIEREGDDRDLRRAWRVTTTCGSVDLRFVPSDFHRENRELLVVSSKFVQGVGRYEGTVRDRSGREHTISTALGVTEDQDTRW
ncbi:MAG: DUF2804 family protein [Myxococcales bacterium]|nr:DUF2804 family protein [Myxococcales bacterium]